MGHPSNIAHKEPDFHSNTISQYMQTWDKHTKVLRAYVDSVMISPLPTRRNGLLGADLTCET